MLGALQHKAMAPKCTAVAKSSQSPDECGDRDNKQATGDIIPGWYVPHLQRHA
jgi:hypothetical protein